MKVRNRANGLFGLVFIKVIIVIVMRAKVPRLSTLDILRPVSVCMFVCLYVCMVSPSCILDQQIHPIIEKITK